MYYFNCQCGINRPKKPDENIYTLYLVVNKEVIPLDPVEVVNISVPFPFCHYIQRVVVVSEPSRVVTPVLRCCQRCVAWQMSKEERVLTRPDFAFSTMSFLPTGTVLIATCGNHQIFLEPL